MRIVEGTHIGLCRLFFCARAAILAVSLTLLYLGLRALLSLVGAAEDSVGAAVKLGCKSFILARYGKLVVDSARRSHIFSFRRNVRIVKGAHTGLQRLFISAKAVILAASLALSLTLFKFKKLI